MGCTFTLAWKDEEDAGVKRSDGGSGGRRRRGRREVRGERRRIKKSNS